MMPGKINPVIPEAARMVSAQVIGNDTVIALSNAMGDFQLNVMLPVIAHNIIQSITILGHVSRLFAEKAIEGAEVNEDQIQASVQRNPMLATVLTPVIGNDKAAEVAVRALKEKKSVKQVVVELGYLSREEADRMLDPGLMTWPGLIVRGS
jgi:fumarate hydratase class II